jgi:YggT family protein
VGAFVANFINLLALALWILVFGRVIVSFVDPAGRTAAGRFLVQTTEPLLAPIRRALPRTGMVDFSPLVLMLVLGAILSVTRL